MTHTTMASILATAQRLEADLQTDHVGEYWTEGYVQVVFDTDGSFEYHGWLNREADNSPDSDGPIELGTGKLEERTRLATLSIRYLDSEGDTLAWDDREDPAFLLPDGTLVNLLTDSDEDVLAKLNQYGEANFDTHEASVRYLYPAIDHTELLDRLGRAASLVKRLSGIPGVEIDQVSEDGLYLSWRQYRDDEQPAKRFQAAWSHTSWCLLEAIDQDGPGLLLLADEDDAWHTLGLAEDEDAFIRLLDEGR